MISSSSMTFALCVLSLTLTNKEEHFYKDEGLLDI